MTLCLIKKAMEYAVSSVWECLRYVIAQSLYCLGPYSHVDKARWENMPKIVLICFKFLYFSFFFLPIVSSILCFSLCCTWVKAWVHPVYRCELSVLIWNKKNLVWIHNFFDYSSNSCISIILVTLLHCTRLVRVWVSSNAEVITDTLSQNCWFKWSVLQAFSFTNRNSTS